MGDIGGHPAVLQRALSDIGINDDLVIPRGTTVIQVGDMVRIGPEFRNGNTAIVRMMKRLTESPRWIQLIGNHECAALGGPSPIHWKVIQSIDENSRSILQNLWNQGNFKIAEAVSDGHTTSLVTHAGLTKNRWHSLGEPDPLESATLLNMSAGQPMAQISDPGRLVTGETNPNADTMWAEVNNELLSPWIDYEGTQFPQIHGHASPYHWQESDWWADTPQSVRDCTEILPALRRTITYTPISNTPYTSVDWNLENRDPGKLWPILSITNHLSEPRTNEH